MRPPRKPPVPPQPPRVIRTLIRLFKETWLFVAIPAVLTFIFIQYMDRVTLERAWIVFLVNLMFAVGMGGTMSLLYTFGFPKLVRRSRNRLHTLGLHAGMIAVGVPIGMETSFFLIRLLPWGDDVHMQRANAYQIAAVISVVIVAIANGYERLRQRAHESERRLEEMHQEAMRLQLESLQARTNPHFLFNSLNTVAGLIEEDPVRAERVLEKFSDLLRYSLTSTRHETVPLATEMTVVREYLEVEGLRLGDRLRVRMDDDPSLEAIPVPPLVLQPLVENAILHGVAPRKEGGWVCVSSVQDNGHLVLAVEDDGPGPGNSEHQGTRTGLEGLRRRLELLYGERASLTVGSGPAGGYRVEVVLPVGQPESGGNGSGPSRNRDNGGFCR